MSRTSTSSAIASSSTVPLPASIVALATPPSFQVASAAHQQLLIHSVHALRESAHVAAQRKLKREKEMVAEGLLPPEALSRGADGLGSGEGEAVDEGVRRRLDTMGFRVGGDLAERLAFTRPRFAEPLDIVKFICKDVWSAAFDKQVDNLRTNHRGVFVLQDALFPTIAHVSTHLGSISDLSKASVHLAFPQAFLRGALARLGLPAVVTAESSGLPQVTFTIKTTKLTLVP